MKNPGGYQIIDLTGVEISASQATTIVDNKLATILRDNVKPILLYGLKVATVEVTAVSCYITDTGAVDGKVYGFVGPGATIAISTNDSNVTFTPTTL